MGNCYSDPSDGLDIDNLDCEMSDMLKRKMNSINFKNDVKVRTNQEILSGYNIIKPLGSGLFSKVYLATDQNGKKFAVKIVKKQDFQVSETIQKIILEKEILKLVEHPNILKLYRSVQSDSRIYFFLEYASKGNILQLLNIKGRLDANEVRVVSAQIIEAILYIHSKGIIYGDLKAENVLIASNGLIKLCDFNLSGTKSILSDKMQGTICYISPEIIEGKKRTRMSDFWALGVLVHLMFYRRYPFRFNNQTDLFYNIINCNIEPEKNEVKAPSSLRRFIGDLLCREVNKRLGKSLDDFINHPFFAGFNWNGYKRDPESFKFAEKIPESENVDSKSDSKTNSDIDDFINIKMTPTTRPIYNIEGFTYDSGAKDLMGNSEHKVSTKEDLETSEANTT